MGVFIGLDIIPARISPESWNEVYRDSLILLDQYPFLDQIIGTRNGIQYIFARRSQHREHICGEEYSGWQSFGDMRTGCNTEQFLLFSDLEAYKCQVKEDDNGSDLLIKGLYRQFDYLEEPAGGCTVWCAKTQGEDSHLYLLAIACLISDRFPDATFIFGNINYAQINWAVEWANQYLKKPIQMPVIATMERLLPRIQGFATNIKDQLDAFFCLCIHGKNSVMGDFLKKQYSLEQLGQYYLNKFNGCEQEGQNFFNVLNEYLELELDFKELVQLLVINEKGHRMEPIAFLKVILQIKLHIEEKDTYDLTATADDRPDSLVVDTVWTLFAHILLDMYGIKNNNVEAYYPLSNILSDCETVLGNIDIEEMAKKVLRELEEEESEKTGNEVELCIRKRMDDMETKLKVLMPNYDICLEEALADYKPGNTIAPDLEKKYLAICQKARELADEDFSEFLLMDRNQRENYFLMRSDQYNVLISEDVWDYFLENVTEAEIIYKFYCLTKVDCRDYGVNRIISKLILNMDLLNYFWDKSRLTEDVS